ncbi:pantoate--beta-alanine ligase [Dermabacteraceae bacterium P7006]
MTKVVTTPDELRAARAELTGKVALVPTMGALHDGHMTLVRRAREIADNVIVSIFVNPLQFGPGEDFERYPRDLEADLATLAGAADLVFAPEVADMYPVLPPRVSVTCGEIATLFEGAIRPGHFDGVATVVTKLFTLTAPDVAIFGQKDAQQLFIIRSLVEDLNLPLTLEAVPIARADDGLALSSRNIYLSAEERKAALALSRLVRAAEAAAPNTAAVLRAVADNRADLDWDYTAVLDHRTFAQIDESFSGEALVMIAARVGGTRLLDNTIVHLRAGE